MTTGAGIISKAWLNVTNWYGGTKNEPVMIHVQQETAVNLEETIYFNTCSHLILTMPTEPGSE